MKIQKKWNEDFSISRDIFSEMKHIYNLKYTRKYTLVNTHACAVAKLLTLTETKTNKPMNVLIQENTQLH